MRVIGLVARAIGEFVMTAPIAIKHESHETDAERGAEAGA
jgi:hypothetical protein